jgi:hypothetical protein
MIEVGGYVINYHDGHYWICFPGGEAMSVTKEKMIEYLERIKREDF